jgi:hypothetical protein
MERELLTRTFMTGWVFAAAFLGSWLPMQDPASLENIKGFLSLSGGDHGVLLGMMVALLSTPVIGYVISSFVLIYMYLRFKDPYNFYSRGMAEQLVERRYPLLCDDRGKRLSWGVDLFAYLVYRKGTAGLAEWGRRRHTTRFLGYNWVLATTLGLVLGATLDCRLLLLLALALFIGAITERCLHYTHSSRTPRRAKTRSGRVRKHAMALWRRICGGWRFQVHTDNHRRPPEVWAARYQAFSFTYVMGLASVFSIAGSWESEPSRTPNLVVASVAAVMLFLSFKASWEVESVERFWVKDYLSKEADLSDNAGPPESKS